jgi:hypothetical protein
MSAFAPLSGTEQTSSALTGGAVKVAFFAPDLPDEHVRQIPVKPCREKYFCFSELESGVCSFPFRLKQRGVRHRHET